MKKVQHTVVAEGERLDKYLTLHNLSTSRSEASTWIQNQKVKINGLFEKPSYVVRKGDILDIDIPSLKSSELTPHEVPFDVVFEDQHILVINKPAGLVVHPGPGNTETSLVHGLLHHCQGELSGIGGVERPGIVHRLDKGTSGLMIVAKSNEAHQKLTEQFQNRKIEKEYLALALYEMQKAEQTLVDLMKRSELHRKKFVVNQKKGKQAITHVRVIQKNKKCSYVSVKIETGRTHQIRVHLRHINHPIMGDELYGGTQKLRGFSPEEVAWVKALGRPLLHSHKLSFQHPLTHKQLLFVQELPQDFEMALRRFFD